MKKFYVAFLIVSSLLISTPSIALPFGASNILVSSDNMLFEYTPDGQLVQQIPIPPIPEYLGQARDLIVTASGEVAIFNGTFDPELSLYDPQTEQWRSFKFPGWSIANNNSNGGIASYGDGIYVTDMLTDGSGIIRFGLDGFAQRYLDGTEYMDLTLGQDGMFYALRAYDKVDVIDPATMMIVGGFQFEQAPDVRGIAVTNRSEIFTVSWNGEFGLYSNDGIAINIEQTGFSNLSDIDIDTQGRIIYQDRDNNVHILDSSSIWPIQFRLPVPYGALSFVTFANTAPAPQSNSNILVSSDNRIFEYTPDGQLVREFPITPIPEYLGQARDLVVTDSGEIVVFNGTFDPELSIFNPQTNTWRGFKYPGWSIANNGSYGGIATYGNSIFVTDMLADGSGIIRFGLDGSAQRFFDGQEYTDLTMGLDGYLYALQAYVGTVDVIDPTTMQVVRNIWLDYANDVRGIAVNQRSEIFAVNWTGELIKYDANGFMLNALPMAWNISDIDIDAQGRIIFQDRNNFVYITNETFTPPLQIGLPVPYNALSFVAFAKSEAIVPENPNILASSDNRVFEFTQDGQLINDFPIPPIPEYLAQARDLVVMDSGEIAVFNGTFDPELSIYNPQTGTWRGFKYPGWSIVNNGSYGGIATYGNSIFVTDMLTDGSGIIRFEMDGFAQRYFDGQEYIDLTMGLDGYLYALQAYVGTVDVIDPNTMQVIHNVWLELANDIRGIAVNQLGEIFAVTWLGELSKYDQYGFRLSVLPIGWNVSDIDINATGTIVFQDRYNNIFITNETGVNPVVFPLPVPTGALSFVAFAQTNSDGGPSIIDSDGDGIADDWELQYGLNPQDPSDASLDSDYDGLTNLQEYTAGSDPWNFDTDGDFLPDGDEVLVFGTDPTNSDTDGDGMPDDFEVFNQLNPLDATDAGMDIDGDGLTNIQEYEYGSNVSSIDSDGDGLNDGDEVNQGLDPADADTDDDGLADGAELSLGLSPMQRDSDNDGVIDGFEHGSIIRVHAQGGYSYTSNDSTDAAVSANGRYVAFASENAYIVSNDTNEAQDVFWSDTVTGEVRRISVSSIGEEANDWSGNSRIARGVDISDDGRFVVFFSSARNLVANDTNYGADIFLHDVQTSQTSLISVNNNGEQANGYSSNPSISSDGRFIVYTSSSTNLLAGPDGNSYESDVFVHDRNTGITTLVSKNSEGVQGNHGSNYGVISANGRYVAFSSIADNLVADDTNGTSSQFLGKDIFVHDLQTGTTERVSVSTDGVQGDSYSEKPSISDDGRYVAFDSVATNFDTNTPPGHDTFVHDRILGKTERIAIDEYEGRTLTQRALGSMSQSGRYIAMLGFRSLSSIAVLIHDRLTGETRLASRSNGGQAIQRRAGSAAISADGQFVAFTTSQNLLVPDKTDNFEDVFLAKTGFAADSPKLLGAKLSSSVISDANEQWQHVAFERLYYSPVVVTTPLYNKYSAPLSVRIQNVSSGGFDIRVTPVDGETTSVTPIDVHYLVAEEGNYNVEEHGINLEAVKYLSTVTDNRSSWQGESRSYLNSYTAPLILGQVMSANDPNFSVFWSHGNKRTNPADSATLYTGKHVGEDPNRARADETIGYIVIESGSGVLGDYRYEAKRGKDIVRGMNNGVYSYSLSDFTAPTSAVLSLTAMDGGDGGWAVLTGSNPLSASSISMAIDEDQLKDTERSHTSEQVDYIVFERLN